MTPRNNAIPERLRQQLDDAHAGLIRVHKALIDHERDRYELAKGRIPGAGEFLQILIHDPWFALVELFGVVQMFGAPIWIGCFVVFAVLAPSRDLRGRMVLAITIEVIVAGLGILHVLVPPHI